LGCHISPTTVPSTFSSILIQTKYHLVHAAYSPDFKTSIQRKIQWISFLFWLFVFGYSGRFWLQVLHWIFIVPITFITFFQYVYNFGPKHHKWSLFGILSNPVPGVKFDGGIGESDNFASLEQHLFNHNLVAQKIARDKNFSAKRATQSSTAIGHSCPMAHINKAAPILLGYQTYAIFHKTSIEDNILKSEYSMPMTLYFAICKYLCPEIVFSLLPRWPSDGIIMAFVITVFIGSIFGNVAIQTCFNISIYSVWKSLVAEIKATIRHTDKTIEFATADNTI
jgi:hypothetical protein